MLTGASAVAYIDHEQFGDIIRFELQQPEIGIEFHLAGDDRLAIGSFRARGADFESAVVAVGLGEETLGGRTVEGFEAIAKALADEDGAGLGGAAAFDGGKAAGGEDAADKGGDEEIGGDAHGGRSRRVGGRAQEWV